MSDLNALFVETDTDPESVLKRFFAAGIQTSYERHILDTRLIVSARGVGFIMNSERVTGPPSYIKYISEGLGFTPNVSLAFFPDKEIDHIDTENRIIEATLNLLKKTKWNLALLFHTAQVPVLMFRAGTLFLNNNKSIWTADRLNRVDLPYTLRNMPNV